MLQQDNNQCVKTSKRHQTILNSNANIVSSFDVESMSSPDDVQWLAQIERLFARGFVYTGRVGFHQHSYLRCDDAGVCVVMQGMVLWRNPALVPGANKPWDSDRLQWPTARTSAEQQQPTAYQGCITGVRMLEIDYFHWQIFLDASNVRLSRTFQQRVALELICKSKAQNADSEEDAMIQPANPCWQGSKLAHSFVSYRTQGQCGSDRLSALRPRVVVW